MDGTTDAQATSSDATTTDAQATSSDASNTDGHVPVPTTLIDDQSSLIGEISLSNGGFWNTFGSPPGTVTPPPGDPFVFTPLDAGPFSSAACVSGSGITGPYGGADFRLQLSAADGGINPYDASAYAGVSFYAMSPDTTEFGVYFFDTNTDPGWPGATCAGGADAGPVPPGGYPAPPCKDAPIDFIPLTTDWQQYSLPFSSFQAIPGAGYYSPAFVDTQGLITMGFQIENPDRNVDGGAPLSFHMCIAQIYFTQ